MSHVKLGEYQLKVISICPLVFNNLERIIIKTGGTTGSTVDKNGITHRKGTTKTKASQSSDFIDPFEDDSILIMLDNPNIVVNLFTDKDFWKNELAGKKTETANLAPVDISTLVWSSSKYENIHVDRKRIPELMAKKIGENRAEKTSKPLADFSVK